MLTFKTKGLEVEKIVKSIKVFKLLNFATDKLPINIKT